MNKVILTGRIATDLKLIEGENKKRLFFTLAVDNGFGDKKTTQFIPVLAWENIAVNIAKYCTKGNKILIEGNITTFKSKDNYDKIMITAFSVEFLGNKNNDKTDNKNTNKSVKSNKEKDFDISFNEFNLEDQAIVWE